MTQRHLDRALAVSLALLPLLPTGPQYLGWTTGPWTEIGLVMFGLLWLASWCAGERLTPLPDRTQPLRRAMLVFLAVASGAAIVGIASENPVDSPVFLAHLGELQSRLFHPMDQVADPLYPFRVWLTLAEGVFGFVLVAALIRRGSDPQRRARQALWGIVCGLGMVSVFAIVQYLTRFELHPYWVEINPNLVRAHATLEDPNTLGAYLVLGVGVTIGMTCADTGRSSRWRPLMAAGIGVLAVVALATTVSRTAAGALGIAVVIAIGWWPFPRTVRHQGWDRVQRGAQSVVALATLVVAGWLFAHGVLPARGDYEPHSPVEAVLATLDPRTPLTEVLGQRQARWMAALHMAAERPVVGVGLGRFPRLSTDYQDILQSPENAHNFFLQLLAEAGLVGLLGFGVVLVRGASTLRATSVVEPHGPWLGFGLTIGVAAFVLTLMTGHSLLLPSGQLLLLTTLAAGLIAIGPGRETRRATSTWAFSAGSICLIAAIAYPAAALTRGFHNNGSRWGYHWGLYGLEQDGQGRPFRWTGARAMMYLPVPSEGEALVLGFGNPVPVRDGQRTEVMVTVGDRTRHVRPEDGAWEWMQFSVDDHDAGRSATDHLLVVVEVRPVMIPALETAGSDDHRRLGVMLLRPRFRSSRTAPEGAVSTAQARRAALT